MELYKKAFETLQSNKFDKKKYLGGVKLYNRAKGDEKRMIGELFEGVMALASPEDIEWINSLPSLYK